MKSTIAIFMKEVRSELRTRYALNALLMFVVTTIAIVLFSIQVESPSPLVYAGVLWIIIFFSSMSGLSRTFVSEEERGTTLFLQLSAAPSSVIYGKGLFNIILLLGLNFFTVLLYTFFIPEFVVKNFMMFSLVLFIGSLSLAVSSTILAAIVSKANTKGTLYPVLSFPILLPLLMSVIDGTKLAVEGAAMSEAFGSFQVLISYLFIMLIVSGMLFPVIWKD